MQRIEYFRQSKLSDKRAGVNGNCYQTAVACLLCIHPSQVPNVETLFDIPDHPDLWADVMNAWLNWKGYIMRTADEFKCFHLKTEEQKLMWRNKYGQAHTVMQEELRGQIYLVVGISPRGVMHNVLYADGQMVWDPHPSDDGLLPVEDETTDYRFEILEPLTT